MSREVLYGSAAHKAYQAIIAKMAAPSTLVPGCFESESLCRAQEEAYRQGYREAELVESIYGWSVRAASGMEDCRRLADKRQGNVDGSLEAAKAWASRWQAKQETRRFVTIGEVASDG